MLRLFFGLFSRPPSTSSRIIHLQPNPQLMKRSFHDFREAMKEPIVRPLAPLQLTPNEARLRLLLLDFAKHHAKSEPEKKLELRWAGGWVRDKLLGIESNDIDIAINCMTGEAFGLELSQFCQQESVIEQYEMQRSDLKGLHLIRLNPEKSKNLETATTQLFGVDLDFVNLRKETYASNSRNPEIEFGTAYEDAMRRDATVNALFYNIHSDCIEDFTGGLEDLEAKLIRTPLEPLQTFMDDPLRVLRLIRFSSRLSFDLDEEVRKFMSDERVLHALKMKITRERVGIELDKMLKGKDPRAALILIDELKLYHAIFTDITKDDLPKPDIQHWSAIYNLLHDLSRDSNPESIYRTLIASSLDEYLIWALASMSPWESVPDEVIVGPKTKANSVARIVSVAREGFRATNKLCDVLTGSHRNIAEIIQFKDDILSNNERINNRGGIAMMIRRWEGNAMNWHLQLFYAMFVEVLKFPADVETVKKNWIRVFEFLREMDLLNAHLIKGLVDGRALCKAMKAKPGKWMKLALDDCLEWQFNHPDVTTIDGVFDGFTLEKLQAHLKESQG
ncbi:hypothetical protein TD95_005270 [Thielaviopsis punctulata]|uniref:Poly A polymerase head domain-containing protein n=1 Tax=Thielaviopsis punctulata TaxID=72032 RepID=A0A0F4ZGW4_9PEZI|nr:hypothetical protein TD95_005270 [Thielaviopsis punctulata]